MDKEPSLKDLPKPPFTAPQFKQVDVSQLVPGKYYYLSR